MSTIKARVTITPPPQTVSRDLFFISPKLAQELYDDPSELLDQLVEHNVTDSDDFVAIQLGYLWPGAVWRKPTGEYRYQVVDMKRVWKYTTPVADKVFSFGLDGSYQLNDEDPTKVVVVQVSQLPNADFLPYLRWATEDK